MTRSPTSFIRQVVLVTLCCLLPLAASADIPVPPPSPPSPSAPSQSSPSQSSPSQSSQSSPSQSPPSAVVTDEPARSKLPLVAAGILLTAGVGAAAYVAVSRKNKS